MKSIWNNKIFSAAGAIFCCALWGISTPIVKMGYAYTDASHVPSLLLWVGIQFALAGLLTVCFYSVVSKSFVRPKRKNIKGVAVVSLLQTVIQYACLYIGLQYTTSVKGAILKSTDVFFVALIASLLFKMEKLTIKKLIACILFLRCHYGQAIFKGRRPGCTERLPNGCGWHRDAADRCRMSRNTGLLGYVSDHPGPVRDLCDFLHPLDGSAET